MTGGKISIRRRSANEAVMDTLMRMTLSGLECSISICDLNGPFFSTSHMFCSVGIVYLLWWDLLPIEPLFACLGNHLTPRTLRLTRCQRLVQYLLGKWLGCIGGGKVGNGTCMKWGAWESQQFRWKGASRDRKSVV